MAPQYKVLYFNARAAAEPSRFALSYAGVQFEDDRYEGTHGSDDAVWQEKKKAYPWGQLPVLEVDGKMLSQSSAILRYLGKQLNLAGSNDFESAKCDEHIEAMSDFKNALFKALFEKDETKKAELVAAVKSDTVPKYLTVWNKTVSSNGGFLVGNKFSIADFCIASWLEIFNETLGGNILDNYPALKSHYDSVFNAKGIKEWVAKRPESKF